MVQYLYHHSRFPSLGIPRLELENPRWNTYVGHWNSNVGIPMSNVGIPTSEFQLQRRNSEAREPTIGCSTSGIVNVVLYWDFILTDEDFSF